MRDPCGFRPLWIGRMGTRQEGAQEAVVVASESTAIDAVGGCLVREMRPGEMMSIDIHTGETEITTFGHGESSQCIFEMIYFADPASTIFNHNVHLFRYETGKRLAEESPVEADVVAPVPHSGIDASMGYAATSGIPYGRIFTTNNYAGRSFIMPEQSTRELKAASKLHVIHETVQDKRLCIIEDSVVRGTTGRATINLLRKAKAKEIHLRIASPPIQHPCFYGIDFPDRSKLLAANKNLEQIREYLGVDSVAYLSLDGLLQCTQDRQGYCLSCFTGE